MQDVVWKDAEGFNTKQKKNAPNNFNSDAVQVHHTITSHTRYLWFLLPFVHFHFSLLSSKLHLRIIGIAQPTTIVTIYSNYMDSHRLFTAPLQPFLNGWIVQIGSGDEVSTSSPQLESSIANESMYYNRVCSGLNLK